MVNKQVKGKKGQRRPGGGKDKFPPPQAGLLEDLYRRKDMAGGGGVGGGHSLQGALWSRTAYEKYLHAFTTLGPPR